MSRTNSSNRGKSDGQYSFAQIPNASIQRSKFNRSSGLTTTFNSGQLVPIFIDEVLPGDTMTLNIQSFARLATAIVPVMDNLYLDVFFFAVPNRLVWDNWQKFMGEQENPGDSTDFTIPTVNVTNAYVSSSLQDYMGLPVGKTGFEHSALFPRAYNLIWNEWFRPQDIVDSIPVNKGDGPDDQTDYTTQWRGKRHDYFTASMPFAQKGPAVPLPIGGIAPLNITTTGGPTFDYDTFTDEPLQAVTGSANLVVQGPVVTPGNLTWNDPGLGGTADLAAATAATVNSIREAFQLQKMYERDARGGTRYTEIIRSHFGVTSPDQRLQRPEYLGGGTDRITFHPVATTSQTNNGNPGELSGFATGSIDGRGFSKSFTEHCMIIGLASIRADQTYQYGMERMWNRRTRFDFYFPSLAHLGEQEVLNKEIYCDGTAADDEIFGYQERWAEYRYKPSKVTGLMRSHPYLASTLHYWHMAQDWDTRPLLNWDFIQEQPPLDRVKYVASEPDCLMDAFFQYTCVRPMPTYSVPGFVDHF